jgi:hypothetical protein
MFEKNRRGSVNKRMFYSLMDENVQYDLKRFQNDENAREALAQEKAILEGEDNQFDILFGTNGVNDDQELGVPIIESELVPDEQSL